MAIYEFTCPECKTVGTTNNLLHSRLCPVCKIDVYSTFDRLNLESVAIDQTNRAIELLDYLIHPSRIQEARRQLDKKKGK
jgi:hypothetical protein